MKRIRLTIPIWLLLGASASPQTGIPTAVTGFHGDRIRLSGEIGSYGEFYSISGRERRRPAQSARFYVRPTLSIYDAMSISFNFLLSTEGSSQSARHEMNQINQLGIRPQWKWGYANGGDFTESFTPLTLHGLNIRGGGIAINPGQFRLSAVGGVTRRIGAGSGEGEFDRRLYAGKIGIGRASRSYIDILFVSARDNPSKFRTVPPDSVVPPDSNQVGTKVQYAETPQENLVVGLASSLKLFADALVVNTELSGSAYTRDLNSPELDNDKLPSFVSDLFTPRLSSSADFAYNANVQIRLAQLNIKSGYRYIGPGYVSLGVASLISDLREFSWGANIRRQSWIASATLTRQNDNLLDQKVYTTIRRTYAGTFSVKLTKVWSVSLLGNLLTLRNNAGSDTALVRYSTISTGVNQMLMFTNGGLFQGIGLNYMFNKASDENPFRAVNGFQSHTVSTNANMTLAQNVWLVPAVSIVSTRLGSQSWMTVETYSLTPQWRTMKNRLYVSMGAGLTRSPSSTSVQTDLAANYRLSVNSSVTASLRRIGFNEDGRQGSNYGEYVASLKLTQRL